MSEIAIFLGLTPRPLILLEICIFSSTTNAELKQNRVESDDIILFDELNYITLWNVKSALRLDLVGHLRIKIRIIPFI